MFRARTESDTKKFDWHGKRKKKDRKMVAELCDVLCVCLCVRESGL